MSAAVVALSPTLGPVVVALGKPNEGSGITRRGIRLILRSFKADPKNHAIAMAGAILFALTLVQFTRTISWATDNTVVPALSGETVTATNAFASAGAVMGIILLRGVGEALRRYFLAIAEYRTEELWRAELFDHYIEQPLPILRAHPQGRLIAHIDSDVNTAGTALKPLAFAVATVVLAIAGLVSLFEIHVWFGLVASVLFPTLALLNQRFSRVVERPAAEVQRAVGDVTSVAHESFDGVMMVKTLGRQEAEVKRFEAESRVLKQRRLTVGRINTFYQPMLRVLPNIGAVLMILVGAVLIDQGSVSVGDLIGALTLLSVLAVPLRIFAFFLQSMPPSVVALDRIDSFLAHDGRSGAADNQLTTGLNTDEVIRFENVQFRYLQGANEHPSNDSYSIDEPVLDDISFSLRKGETVALVGNTGVGKTTIAELASGLLNPTKGYVRRPEDLTLLPVLQEAFLFNDSVEQNVTLGATIPADRVHEAAQLAQAHSFISDLPDGYGTVIGERGVTLSGGQRQRVALTRALARRPDLLVLDDATSAIDPLVESAILQSLRDQELTMLVIANRLSTIRLADRVLFVQAGTIAASGTHDELLELGDYRSLVASELDGQSV